MRAWKRDGDNWWRSDLGGISRDDIGFWWWPAGSSNQHGPFETLAEAEMYAENEKPITGDEA